VVREDSLMDIWRDLYYAVVGVGRVTVEKTSQLGDREAYRRFAKRSTELYKDLVQRGRRRSSGRDGITAKQVSGKPAGRSKTTTKTTRKRTGTAKPAAKTTRKRTGTKQTTRARAGSDKVEAGGSSSTPVQEPNLSSGRETE
jgi:hypothetical protein